MSFTPLLLENLSLSFPHKTCFDEFSTQIYRGDYIAIIGKNGAGKSSLLNMIKNIAIGEGLIVEHIPQIIKNKLDLSGGEKFNKLLHEALRKNPELLLLDEPTNNLDLMSRRNLVKKLENFVGTIIVVSHDVELLQKFHILWHINNGEIEIFSGNYFDYMEAKSQEYKALEQQLSYLQKEKKSQHEALMKEQKRAKASKALGEKNIKMRKWPTIVSDSKARRAQETSGRKKANIEKKKQDILASMATIYIPEIIKPKFHLTSNDLGNKNLIHILRASCRYKDNILSNINLTLGSGEKIALVGNNGSGKSTLVKAILQDSAITKSGDWRVPNVPDIGYLDQHYSNLQFGITVIEALENLVPEWSHLEIRRHLNDFLFRKSEEVSMMISELSGGEKVRLSLGMIAAKSPPLLILDEITNNLDIDTRQHVIEVLSFYPGSMIVISHDEDFLSKIGITDKIAVQTFK